VQVTINRFKNDLVSGYTLFFRRLADLLQGLFVRLGIDPFHYIIPFLPL
jgi:hypothetical protein